MDKSRDAFRTISEVAEDLDVPQHVLRFWEGKFHQVKPMKRGGGRRYYRPGDVELLRGIKKLLYGDGFTIKGVQKILREQGLAHVQAAGADTAEAGKEPAGQDEKGQKTQPSIISKSPPVRDKTASRGGEGGGGATPALAETPVAPAPPAAATAKTGLNKEQIRLLKATLFELSEIKTLLESAPEKRP